MDHLHRLMARALAGLLFLAALVAHASFPSTPGAKEYANQAWSGMANQWFSSTQAACQASASFGGYTLTSVVGLTCNFAHPNGTSAGGVNLTERTTTATCPSNSTIDGTNTICTCNPGFTQVQDGATYSCVPNDVATCGALSGSAPTTLTCTGPYCSWFSPSRNYSTTSGGDPNACITLPSGIGCEVAGDLDVAAPAQEGAESGPWVVRTSRNRYTGSPCAAGTANPASPPPSGAKTTDLAQSNTGKCRGTVNGVDVYLPCSTGTSERTDTKTDTTTNPDGTTSSKEETVTSKTECKDGVCTTTKTTTKTEDGQTTTTTGSSTQGRGAYCAENPSDPQCADESAWAGSCQAGFECRGDAALCAAARGVHEQKCALVDGPATPTSEQNAYAAAKAGGEAYTVPVTGVSISAANFDSSNALGVSGACIADVPIVVWGTSITLPLTKVCPHLEMLGTVMLAVAWLMAAVIVGKGITA